MGFDVQVKEIASSFLAVFGCLKISKGISLALNMLLLLCYSSQYAISDLGYFCSNNVLFSSLKRFSFTLPFSAMVQILLGRENGIFVKQCRGWFDVNGTYRFESVSLF